MRKLLVLAVAVAALAAIPGTALAAGKGAGGVTGPAFYVDGELYRTVVTPTDLSGTGAPASSFDTIYAIGDQNHNVATAAPGDEGYNGGRWRVQVLTFSDYAAAVMDFDANGSGDLDSAAEVEAAIDAGYVSDIADGPSFECPVIPVPRNR